MKKSRVAAHQRLPLHARYLYANTETSEVIIVAVLAAARRLQIPWVQSQTTNWSKLADDEHSWEELQVESWVQQGDRRNLRKTDIMNIGLN